MRLVVCYFWEIVLVSTNDQNWYTAICFAIRQFRALQMEDIPQFNFHALAPYRETFVRTQLYFPDKYLMQYDCGKLQVLARLLAKLKSEGSRCAICCLQIVWKYVNRSCHFLRCAMSLFEHNQFSAGGLCSF